MIKKWLHLHSEEKTKRLEKGGSHYVSVSRWGGAGGEGVESMSTTAKNGGLFYFLRFTVVFSHAVERR